MASTVVPSPEKAKEGQKKLTKSSEDATHHLLAAARTNLGEVEKGSSSSKPSSSPLPTSHRPSAQPHCSSAVVAEANAATKDVARQSTGKAAEAMDETELRRTTPATKKLTDLTIPYSN